MKKQAHLSNGMQLDFYAFGQGKKVIIALAGFGDEPRPYKKLASRLGEQYSVILPQLPFKTEEPQQKPYTPEDIHVLVQYLLGAYSVKSVDLLGHSLGGRIWLKALGFLPLQCISSLTLVAPDGIGGRYTNWIDRLPEWAIRRISPVINRPGGVLKLADFLRRHRLINAFSYRFLQQQLKSSYFRNRLSGTLRSLPYFKLDKTDFSYVAQLKRVTIITGKKDRLVYPEKIEAAFQSFTNVSFLTTKGGHALPTMELVELYR